MVGTAIGAVAGFVIGVAGSMVFDTIYNRAAPAVREFVSDVGNAVSGFFSGVARIFGG